jgi:hypothetical protein
MAVTPAGPGHNPARRTFRFIVPDHLRQGSILGSILACLLVHLFALYPVEAVIDQWLLIMFSHA